MKNLTLKSRLCLGLVIVFFILISFSCSTAKDAQERKHLMMPRKDELPNNKKYTSVKKRKTYKIKHNKKKKKKTKRYF